MSNQLWSDDEGDVGTNANTTNTQLTINEHYAKAFAYRKEREELERLKAKYGSDYDDDSNASDESIDSESAESEDEHGEELTPAVDAAILRTLARIKKRDPEIYNSEKNIFGEEREKVGSGGGGAAGPSKSKTKSKPVTIKDVNLQSMLNPSSRSPSPSPSPSREVEITTYAQEQETLRKATIAAFHHAAETAGDEDDFLVPREKTKDEQEREEEEYRAFLEREVGDLDLKELVSVDVGVKEEDGEGEVDEVKEEEGKKKKKKSKKAEDKTRKSKAEEDQEFLLNYILNRGWIDKSEGHVPTYHEVTESAPERRKKKSKTKPEDDTEVKSEHDDEDEMDTGLLSDASFESLASHFEASYNHRFEEPGAASIPSFPRNLPSLVRREDTTRKDARARRKERKAAELEKKKEEVRRMKALKMREVKRKLEVIGRQGGLKMRSGDGKEGDEEGEGGDGFMDEALRELDLEGEWDPEKHDRQMAGLFDRAEFEDDAGADVDEEEGGAFGAGDGDDDGVRYDADGKPIWDDDVDIGDIPISDDDAYGAPGPSKKDKKKKKKKKKGGEDGDDAGVDVDAMDADVEPGFEDEEEWDGTEEMRKRIFNKYMDEIYGLDFNDMVGDMPTRFKYVPVQPQTYALTPAEILMATDQELNEYMSVKKYAPYREDKNENRHRYNPKNQEKLREIKSKVNERTGGKFAGASTSRHHHAGGEDGQGGQGGEKKKRMGKKERMRLKAAAAGTEPQGDVDVDRDGDVEMKSPAPKSKKRKHEQDQNNGDTEMAPPVASKESRQEEEGDGSAKKKRKRKHKKKDGKE